MLKQTERLLLRELRLIGFLPKEQRQKEKRLQLRLRQIELLQR
jgi:hypothetical protein